MKLHSQKLLIRLLLVITSLLFINNELITQNDLINHKKYYFYKTRLQNDFMKLGLLSGEGLPFNERGFVDSKGGNNPLTSTNYLNELTQNPGSLDHIKAGDCSARLGIYLAGLATEYKLLKNNGQDLTKIKHEIFLALSAINRLDFFAEPLISASLNPANPNIGNILSPSLNGFFVRDDIPANFVKTNYTSFNYFNNGLDANGFPNNKLNDHGFCPTFANPLDGPRGQIELFSGTKAFQSTSSTFDNWNNQTIIVNGNLVKDKGALDGYEMSQDQAYYIIMACALVKELVDPNETDNGAVFGFGAGGTLLRQQAIDIVTRIVTHMKNDQFYNLRNPANQNKIVQTGGVETFASYAIDNAAAFVKHNGINGDFISNEMPRFTNGGLVNTYPLRRITNPSQFNTTQTILICNTKR